MESTLLNVHHLKREVQDNFLGHHSAVHHLKREVQDNFPSNYIQTPYSHQSLLGLCHLQGRILTNAGASDFKSLVRMLSVLTATSFQTSGGKSPLHLWLLSSAAGLDATFYDESFDSLPDDWKSPRPVIFYTSSQLLELLSFTRSNIPLQDAGMSTLYTQCESFAAFVQFLWPYSLLSQSPPGWDPRGHVWTRKLRVWQINIPRWFGHDFEAQASHSHVNKWGL